MGHIKRTVLRAVKRKVMNFHQRRYVEPDASCDRDQIATISPEITLEKSRS